MERLFKWVRLFGRGKKEPKAIKESAKESAKETTTQFALTLELLDRFIPLKFNDDGIHRFYTAPTNKQVVDNSTLDELNKVGRVWSLDYVDNEWYISRGMTTKRLMVSYDYISNRSL